MALHQDDTTLRIQFEITETLVSQGMMEATYKQASNVTRSNTVKADAALKLRNADMAVIKISRHRAL
ncbi:MAG: hypothetical protein FRX49_02084 [Trebouxia sp. A1-2]|nr:MAG: hypothetical protein FRX49_02084 [Trebouxia sp. A1-2]